MFQFERVVAQLKILVWKDLYPLLATFLQKEKLQAFSLKRGKGNHVWEIDKNIFLSYLVNAICNCNWTQGSSSRGAAAYRVLESSHSPENEVV